LETFTLFRTNVRAEKTKNELILQFFDKGLPSRAGEGETVIPAAFHAAVFGAASPLPPEMIRAGVAHAAAGRRRDASYEADIGFLRPRLASSLMNCAASSSAAPPISRS